MSISEIIARFTRTGLVPQSYARRDDGGNTAVEPDFDPLDEYTEVMAAQAARKAAAGLRDPANSSPKENTEPPSPARSAEPGEPGGAGAPAQ